MEASSSSSLMHTGRLPFCVQGKVGACVSKSPNASSGEPLMACDVAPQENLQLLVTARMTKMPERARLRRESGAPPRNCRNSFRSRYHEYNNPYRTGTDRWWQEMGRQGRGVVNQQV